MTDAIEQHYIDKDANETKEALRLCHADIDAAHRLPVRLVTTAVFSRYLDLLAEERVYLQSLNK